MTGFNLRKIKTTDTFEHKVRDEEGNDTGVVFVLAGPTHPVRRDADYAQRRKLIAAAKKSGKVEVPDPERQDAESIAYVGRAVLGWRGFIDDAGQPVAYSPDAAVGLLSDPQMKWLLDQIDRELGNAANFTKRA